MRVGVVSLFPEMFRALTDYGVTGRAVKTGRLSLSTANPRDFTVDKHRTVDDKSYGGGPGMVMKSEPLAAALDHLKQGLGSSVRVVYLSPQGQRLTQAAVERFSQLPALLLVAGRYEGVDERFIEAHVDEEWSVGDFVVSGGELPAMLMTDAIARLLPGVLGDEQSAQQDSFSDGLLDCPHYTRPEVLEGNAVPEVLLSGNHERIRLWRLKQSLQRTWLRRPELLQDLQLDDEQQGLLAEIIRELSDEPT